MRGNGAVAAEQQLARGPECSQWHLVYASLSRCLSLSLSLSTLKLTKCSCGECNDRIPSLHVSSDNSCREVVRWTGDQKGVYDRPHIA
jgi:hypothetical protein